MCNSAVARTVFGLTDMNRCDVKILQSKENLRLLLFDQRSTFCTQCAQDYVRRNTPERLALFPAADCKGIARGKVAIT